jgi:acyl dehydratase
MSSGPPGRTASGGNVWDERTLMSTTETAPKVWRGRFFEDFDVGDVFRSRFGRTITDTDNIWFTCLTMNTNPMHFDVPYSEGTRFKQPLVNSAFTLALVTGMTVPDTSENAAANLAWTDIKLPKPVYVGDTLYSESEITDKRESKSNPSVGIVSMRTRGLNQRGEVVIEFKRTFMVYKRDAPEVTDTFPKTTEEWTV